MNTYLIIALILFSLGGIFSLQRALQMFQQNSYFPSRYFKWFKENVSIIHFNSALFLIATATLCIINAVHFLPAIAFFECIIRFFKWRKTDKTSIKKLVYTGRVKRLIATCITLLTALVVLGFALKNLTPVFGVAVLVFSHFPAILMLFANTLNSPIEKGINNKFIKEAKSILKKNRNLLVIGVTGSFGKTSVKFILNRILSEKFNVVCTPESFNTPMGVVRTVREKVKSQTEIFIAEMGAKKPFDIKELCDLADPTVGLISAVGEQHLETFGNLETVAKTKFELADHCKKKSGKVYVNFDSEPAKKYAKEHFDGDLIISVGTSKTDICSAENITAGKNGTQFDLIYKNYSPITLNCKLLGKHSITNILLAAATALDLGVSEKQIRFAVSSLKAPAHRLELKSFMKGSLLIDDAYNSNPEGCLEAVRVLGSFEGMRKVLVTPGLVELGDKEYECNFNLGNEATKYCDDIILVGKKRAVPMKDAIDKTDFDRKRVFIADSFKQAMEYYSTFADSNTVVLFENDLPDNYAG